MNWTVLGPLAQLLAPFVAMGAALLVAFFVGKRGQSQADQLKNAQQEAKDATSREGQIARADNAAAGVANADAAGSVRAHDPFERS